MSESPSNFLDDHSLNTRKSFEGFKEGLHSSEPVYEAMIDEIVNNPDILTLASQSLSNQPTPNIFFAAIQYLLLDGTKHDLRDFYPNLTTKALDPKKIGPSLSDFVKKNRKKLLKLIKTQSVQTNEVGRCSIFLLGFDFVFKSFGEELILLEIGSSAGLNLNFNKYNYEYYNNNSSWTIPAESSKVNLKSEFRGSITPQVPSEFPPLIKKIGIDLKPLEVGDKHDALWLESLIWPSLLSRHQDLRNAIEIMKDNKVWILKQDGFREIIKILDMITFKGQIVIFHSFAINQIKSKQREEFYEKIGRFSLKSNRRIIVLSLEGLTDEGTLLICDEYFNGIKSSKTLANCHYHGRWIKWLNES